MDDMEFSFDSGKIGVLRIGWELGRAADLRLGGSDSVGYGIGGGGRSRR